MQIHLGDSYEISYGDSRASFYGVTGTPADRYDGNMGHNGWPGSASPYISQFNTRLGVETDVTIDMAGSHAEGDTYNVTVRVGVEPDGLRRNMRIHCVMVRDFYPATPTYHRNCLVAAADYVTHNVHPGNCVDLEYEFDIPESWDRDNVKIIAWAQVPNSYGPASTYQAGIMEWPFEPFEQMGDYDNNGEVGLTDVGGLEACMAGPDSDAPQGQCVNRLDYDQDGDVDLRDVAEFQSTFMTTFDGCS